MSVINLSNRRQPVAYTVRITHYWDDRIEVLVEDVADDERSRQSVADALSRAASAFGNRAAPMLEDADRLTRERDEARAEVERLREALREWDALVKHQYSGTRDAMSDMQHAALHTKRLLDALEAEP